MQIRFDQLRGRSIAAVDGDIGKVDEFFFDDRSWKLRYLVVDTRKWLPGRKVLIDPSALKPPHPEEGALPADLTKQKVKESPDIDTEKPISRREQADLHVHYGWPLYFGGGSLSSARTHGTSPEATASGVREDEAPPSTTPGTGDAEAEEADPHLRSAKEVEGYAATVADAEVARVRDFVIDTDSWEIRRLVCRKEKQDGDREVTVPVDVVQSIHWTSAQVRLDPEAKDRF
ncbi:MAG: PRC-barrel domain containing protein [Candidatus Eisenbacteria bacterium]|nr:PRC-barrel domain containing protein [Candidatus Latescibacterota bacterium]MBD3301197.1 PRC-barrel domain containing protein [Candidatus Eisenbacteria bacterium]